MQTRGWRSFCSLILRRELMDAVAVGHVYEAVGVDGDRAGEVLGAAAGAKIEFSVAGAAPAPIGSGTDRRRRRPGCDCCRRPARGFQLSDLVLGQYRFAVGPIRICGTSQPRPVGYYKVWPLLGPMPCNGHLVQRYFAHTPLIDCISIWT